MRQSGELHLKARKNVSRLKRFRALILALSSIVVFVTTYLLILPALTLEKDKAQEQGGIFVSSESSEEYSSSDQDKTEPAAEQAETAQEESAQKDTQAPVYRAGELSFAGNKYDVKASYAKKAKLPEDTELKVKEVTANSDDYDTYYQKALQGLQNDAGTDRVSDLSFARFYDISLMADGSAVEPADVVNVSISYDKGLPVENADHVRIVHFTEDEKTGKIEPEILKSNDVDVTIKKETMTEASFDAKSFSVYGVVYEQISTDVITAKGETYTITVDFDENAEIPAGARLKAEEIAEDSADYKTYLADSANELKVKSDDVLFARFFDIEIVDKDGATIEPKSPVTVHVAYKDSLEIGKKDSLSIVHFADRGTEVISDISVSDDKKEISYQQDSFSVTGTIINGEPSGNAQHMVIVQDGTRYYIVNNDMTLTEVGYDQASNTVIVDDPMLWTFEESGNNKHIYFNSEATGFGTNLIASDYYRRYMDPRTDQAWLQEQSKNESDHDSYVTVKPKIEYDWWGNPVTDANGYFDNKGQRIQSNQIPDPDGRLNPLNATNLKIAGGTISDINGTQYLKIVRDAAGTPVRLTSGGSSSEAAHFIYADASKVPSGLHHDHAVNHIDISISGSTQVKVPLAYGKYYDADGNVILEVTENTNVTLTDDQVVIEEGEPDPTEITVEDMKRAAITARDKDGNELDDVFYITGFSQNADTEFSTSQVRIDGRFLVSDLRGTEYEHLNESRYYGGFDGNRYWWPDTNYISAVRQARKDNVIDYTVTVTKPITYYLVNPSDPTQLLYDSDGNPMKVTVDVAFSGSFNYWDYGKTAKNGGNECPPLQNNADWRAGDIPNHDMSGMDFVLNGDLENPNSPLVAIEITKVIVDENGNRIDVKVPVTTKFDIYENRTANRNGVTEINANRYTGDELNHPEIYDGYEKLRTRTITVGDGDNGTALIYDYNVTDAMYYIAEHSDADLPKTVTDKSNQEWDYVKTYIETEYVRRGDSHDSDADPMHISKDYTLEEDGTDGFKSIPEVSGKFTTLKGEQKKSAFLEFFVYNVYTRGRDVPVEKKWGDHTTAPEGAQVNAELRYAERKIKNADGSDVEEVAPWPAKDQYKKVVAGQNGFAQDLTTELVLKADSDASKNWKGTFKDLPRTRKDSDGSIYELDYYAVETAVTIPGDGDKRKDITNQYTAETKVNDDGTIVITNEAAAVVKVKKTWNPTPSDPDTYVKVHLKRLKWQAPPTTDVRVVKVWNDENDQDGKRPADLTVTLLKNGQPTDTVLTLNKGNQWSGTVKDLPELDDQNQPITYSWSEVSVDGYTSTSSTDNNVTTLTNTHVPETTSATIIVNWNDNDNEAGKRPESLTATLSNGQDVTLNADNNWRATVEDLPKYNKGKLVEYSWTDPVVPDYNLINTETSDPNTTTFTYEPKPVKPPKDTVTITVTTELYQEFEDQDFWNNNNWSTILYGLKLDGKAADPGIQESGRNKYSSNRVVTFEVPKNTEVVFYVGAGGSDVKLNSILSPIGFKSLNQTDNGSRYVKLKVGTDDVDLYAILSKTDVPEIEPGIPPVETGSAKVFVYVGYNINESIQDSNVDLVNDEVPYNSTLELNYHSYAIDQYNNWSGGSWKLYYWDTESNLDWYHWAEVTPAQSGNNPEGNAASVSIGNEDKYCIVISAERRDDWTKADFSLTVAGNENNSMSLLFTEAAGRIVRTMQYKQGASAIAEDGEDTKVTASANTAVKSAESKVTTKSSSTPPRKAAANSSDMTSPYTIPAGENYADDDAFNADDDSDQQVVLTLKDGEGFGWEQEFPAQEKYDENGKPYIYYVEEIESYPEGYTVETITGDPNQGEEVVITNTKLRSIALDILKVDEENANKHLPDAEFTLQQIDGTSASISTIGQARTQTTGADGTLSFPDLAPGYYEITETSAPEGYILTGELTFYIEVTADKVLLLTKGGGAPSTWDKTAVSYGNVTEFTGTTETDNALATVENTPGKPLPFTGGAGTRMQYLLGLALVAGAAVLMLLRRRRTPDLK